MESAVVAVVVWLWPNSMWLIVGGVVTTSLYPEWYKFQPDGALWWGVDAPVNYYDRFVSWFR